MNRAFLKSLCLLLLTVLSATSCGAGFSISTVPFPTSKTWDDKGAWSVAFHCDKGGFVGKNINDESTWRHGHSAYKYIGRVPFVSAPDGNGKVYTLCLTETTRSQFTDSKGQSRWAHEKSGYTFILYATDADIITKCRATVRLIEGHPWDFFRQNRLTPPERQPHTERRHGGHKENRKPDSGTENYPK